MRLTAVFLVASLSAPQHPHSQTHTPRNQSPSLPRTMVRGWLLVLSTLLATASLCTRPAHGLEPAAMASDWRTLTAGVTQLSGDVYFSTYDLFGDAFPVLRMAGSTVAAAARYGAGRCFAVAHEGVLGRQSSPSWSRFLSNTAAWVGRNRSTIRLATSSPSYQPLLQALVDEMPSKFQAWDPSSPTPFILSQSDLALENGGQFVDVYVTDVYTETSWDEAEGLVAWVQGGGGLIYGGHAWYWLYSHDKASLYTDLPGNRVLVPLGLPLNAGSYNAGAGSFSFETINGTTFRARPPPPTPPPHPRSPAALRPPAPPPSPPGDDRFPAPNSSTLAAYASAFGSIMSGVTPGGQQGSAAGAYCSNLILFHAAMPIVATNGGIQLAAATAGKGRVVVGGHEGAVFVPRSTSPTLAALASNAAAWAGRAAAGRPVRVAGINAAAATFIVNTLVPLSSNGAFQLYTSSPTGQASGRPLVTVDEFAAHSPQLDLWLGDCYFSDSVSNATLDTVEAWVRAGGGLLTACHTWYWSYGGGDVLNANAANRLLTRFGIYVSPEVRTLGSPLNAAAPDLRTTSLTYMPAAALAVTLRQPPLLGVASVKQLLAAVRSAMQMRELPRIAPALVDALQRISYTVGGPPLTSPSDPPFQPSPAKFARSLALWWESARSKGQAVDKASIQASPMARRFPGLPAAGAAIRSQYAVTINGTYITAGVRTIWSSSVDWAWRSTGTYAPPGALVTVALPLAAARSGLFRIQIGCHTDELWDHASLDRAPAVVRAFDVNPSNVSQLGGSQVSTTQVGSAFGGLVYILVKRGAALGPTTAVFSGVVLAPRFVRGVTSEQEWRSTVRNLPGPWAEFEGRRMVLTVRSEYAARVSNPSALVNYYDAILDGHAALANISLFRPNKERMVTDIQISAGYMHSGMPFMAFANDGEWLVNLTAVSGSSSNWGVYHEWGHNHQIGFFQWGDYLGEVTNNWFSMHATEELNDPSALVNPDYNMNPARIARDVRQWMSVPAANRRFADISDPFMSLTMYKQLRDAFGWGLFTRLYTVAWQMQEAGQAWPDTPAGKISLWVGETCRYARFNLMPFYTQWGVTYAGVAAAAQATCRSFPDWTSNPLSSFSS